MNFPQLDIVNNIALSTIQVIDVETCNTVADVPRQLSGTNPLALATLLAAAPALRDRLLSRMDRCACHPSAFDPDTHEGRGPGTCTECEADREALAHLPVHYCRCGWDTSIPLDRRPLVPCHKEMCACLNSDITATAKDN